MLLLLLLCSEPSLLGKEAGAELVEALILLSEPEPGGLGHHALLAHELLSSQLVQLIQALACGRNLGLKTARILKPGQLGL